MKRTAKAARARSAAHAAAAAAALVLAALLPAGAAGAQEFAGPEPPLGASPSGLLERALPQASRRTAFEALAIRWFGLPELGTASAAVAGGWRGVRAAAGLSRTGEEPAGWSALAAAGGWCDASAGAAMRAVLRRSREGGGASIWGLETGVGAWARAAPRVKIWASAPQLWTQGEAPPLARRLELGLSVRGDEIEAWLSRAVAPGAPEGLRGEHTAGLAVRASALMLWAQVADQPPRGGFGLAIAWRSLRIACESDTHPVLGETTRIAVGSGSAAP